MSHAPKMPPLLVLAVAAGLAWLLDLFIGTPSPRSGMVVWGLVVSGLGAAAAVAGVIEFRRAQTTVDPIHPDHASALVSSGIYRFTRNPMYVGFALMLLGWIVALGSLPATGVLAAFALYLDRFQIPPDEAALPNRFGEAFDAYATRVRRWL